MGQEFFINSQELENKIRSLLPSQGGAGAGFDLSASTQIIPIIDLTESAEGSNVRQDLQTAFSLNTITATNVQNSNNTIISTTGYFRINGVVNTFGAGNIFFNVTDGTTTKTMYQYVGSTTSNNSTNFNFIVFLEAGHSFQVNSTSANNVTQVISRQIADIDGNLSNP